MEDQSHRGLADTLRDILHAGISYLRSRSELFGLESKEAMNQIAGFLLLFAVAAATGLVGYLLICLAAVFGIAHWFGGDKAWIIVSLAAGAIHVVLGYLVIRAARGWLKKPMFKSTLEEFRKDEAWLKSNVKKPL
jgi:uncharacterized membrane protein YqjE